jgi:hypothetical protein
MVPELGGQRQTVDVTEYFRLTLGRIFYVEWTRRVKLALGYVFRTILATIIGQHVQQVLSLYCDPGLGGCD